LQIIEKQLRKDRNKLAVERIVATNRQLANLVQTVDELVDATKATHSSISIQKEIIDIRILVEELVSALQTTSNIHKITVKCSVKTPIMADRHRITQVFSNLITNSIKYSPQGGEIVVKMWKKNGKFYASVTDGGDGIPPEKIRTVFDRFYRVPTETSERIAGLGLGLFITRAIVQAHKGEISATSTIGKGTTMLFFIPAK
jgi:signal transduction histidine kinase